MGTGPNAMHRKIDKVIIGKDEAGQDVKYIVAIFRGTALGPHDSQSIRVWYNFSPSANRYKSSTVVFCALDMEEKACEVYESINNEDDVKRILAEPMILHTGKWW